MEIPQSNHHFYTFFAYSFNTKGFAFLSFASGQRICKFSCLLKWSRCQNTVARIQHSGLFSICRQKDSLCFEMFSQDTHEEKIQLTPNQCHFFSSFRKPCQNYIKICFLWETRKGVIIKVLLALLSPVLDALYCIMWNGGSGIVFKVCCIKADTLYQSCCST